VQFLQEGVRSDLWIAVAAPQEDLAADRHHRILLAIAIQCALEGGGKLAEVLFRTRPSALAGSFGAPHVVRQDGIHPQQFLLDAFRYKPRSLDVEVNDQALGVAREPIGESDYRGVL
jgi:hypothetical protein